MATRTDEVIDAVPAAVAAQALGVRPKELRILAKRRLIPYHNVPQYANHAFRIEELRSFAPLMPLIMQLRETVPVEHSCTREQYDELLDRQNGKCAICGKEPGHAGRISKRKPRLVVDHDHTTGVVRGLLCSSCNTGIGHLGDSVELVKRALDYLLTAGRPSLDQ